MMGVFSWLHSRRSTTDEPGRLRLLMPTEQDHEVDERKEAAAEDIAEMQAERKYFRPDAPGNYQDEL